MALFQDLGSREAPGPGNLEAEIGRKLREDGGMEFGYLRDASYPFRTVQAAKIRERKKQKGKPKIPEALAGYKML